MKFNKYLWNLYKNSSEGKSAIAAFSDRKEWMEEECLFEKYNPKIKDSFNSEVICGILEDFWCYKVSEHEGAELKSLEEAGKLYEEIECIMVYDDKNGFSRSRYRKYYWEDMKNPDLYNELKNKLNT